MSVFRGLIDRLQPKKEVIEPIKPIAKEELEKLPPGEYNIIAKHVKGQQKFFHRTNSDPSTEPVINYCTLLPDGNLVTPFNWQEMGWCPKCENPRMSSSIRFCKGCGEEGCKTCIEGKRSICGVCGAAKFFMG